MSTKKNPQSLFHHLHTHTHTQNSVRRLGTHQRRQCETATTNSEAKHSGLQVALATRRTDLKKYVRENAAQNDAQQRRRYRTMDSITEWTRKYDAEFGALADEVNAERSAERALVEKIEQYRRNNFDPLYVKYRVVFLEKLKIKQDKALRKGMEVYASLSRTFFHSLDIWPTPYSFKHTQLSRANGDTYTAWLPGLGANSVGA